MMRKRLLFVAALACVPITIATTSVIAGADKTKSRTIYIKGRERPVAAQDVRTAEVLLNGQASGGGCRLGFDTRDDYSVPTGEPDTFEAVAGVRVKKPCDGVVIGQFVTETDLNDPEGYGYLDAVMVAFCVGTGGYSNACSPGSEVVAFPGLIELDGDVQYEIETRSMNAVWPKLKRGLWDFGVFVNGDGEYAQVGYRTFHVEAFSGGPAS